jgi:NADH-quinone oxidoreductase subunit J
MEFKSFLFYLFSALMLLASVRVITARNPVHAVLFLVLAFFNAAGLWLLLQAEFLAIMLIMVYVGAVMVLFLFVVMMLDINIERLRQGFWKNLPLGGLVALVMVGEMAVVLSGRYFSLESMPASSFPADYSNTKVLAREMFTNFAYPVEIASVILLVAIIAAVMLTLRKRPGNKAVHPSDQIAVKRNDRIRMVKMKAEVDAPVDAAAIPATEGEGKA